MIRLTKSEAAELLGKEAVQPRHKYNARRTEYKGRWYPSKAQANRAMKLDMLKMLGHVAWWFPEQPIPIGDPKVDKPFKVDFLVAMRTQDGTSVVVHAEDVKGYETETFRRRIRQWRQYGPFPLHILRKDRIEIITPGERS